MDRDYLDRLALARRYCGLANQADPLAIDDVKPRPVGAEAINHPDARIADQLHYATSPADPNDPESADAGDVNAGLRAFDALPEDARRSILNGWAPIEHDRRARGVDVLAALASSAPLSRVLVFAVEVELDAARQNILRQNARVRQDWAPLDSDHSVRVVVREGTSREQVVATLASLACEISSGTMPWAPLVNAAPLGVYRRRRGQVWRAYDMQSAHDGFLVTAENDVDRPIAYVTYGDLSEADALDLAEEIARSPSRASANGATDLRHYGHEDSRDPTPGFLYGISCEPASGPILEPDERLTPRPFCRFLLQRLREKGPHLYAADGVNLYEPAHENGGSPSRSTAPQPVSKGSGGDEFDGRQVTTNQAGCP